MTYTRDELVARLARAGELEVAGADQDDDAAADRPVVERGADGAEVLGESGVVTFVRPFTHSPVGRLEPNGARVVWDLINIFRFDDRGRLVEEFVRTDNRSLVRQLGCRPG